MEKKMFVTITGIGHYYGEKPFEIGTVVRLRKEFDNEYDDEAIMVEMPYIGKVGYIANGYKTIAKGTMSAGRLYDKIANIAFARVMFVFGSTVIAEVLEDDIIIRGKVFDDIEIKVEWD
ncbi:MAG: DNA-binding protein [Clostridia bacterium]|nr:DNA-binding protein [Clostridia bacterium]